MRHKRSAREEVACHCKTAKYAPRIVGKNETIVGKNETIVGKNETMPKNRGRGVGHLMDYPRGPRVYTVVDR